MGNDQKNLSLADYPLFQNEYAANHVVKDFMIENISSGKTVLTGYPQNAAF